MKTERKIIIAVDDDATTPAVYKRILRPYYEIYTVSTATKLFVLPEKPVPDLIPLDADMPELNGYETARILKNIKEYGEFPFIFATAESDEKTAWNRIPTITSFSATPKFSRAGTANAGTVRAIPTACRDYKPLWEAV